MNTFKKLIFGLLLSGMAFTVGCGDNKKDPVKENGDCTKEDKCDQNLACVVANDGDTKGKCQKVCKLDDDCGAAKECSKAVKTVDKKDVKQCKAKTATEEKIAEGDPCTAETQGKCVDGTKCLVDGTAAKCTKTCDPAVATDCSGATPDCLKEGVKVGETAKSVNICGKAPAATPLAEGGQGCVADGSDATKACASGFTCVTVNIGGADVDMCAKECTKQSGCSDSMFAACLDLGAKKKEDGTTAVKTCYHGSHNLGDDCDSTSFDMDKHCAEGHVCNPTSSKCLVECKAEGNGSTDCSAATDGSAASTPTPNCTADDGILSCTA